MGAGVLPAQHGAWPGTPTLSSSSDIPKEGEGGHIVPQASTSACPTGHRPQVPGPRGAGVCRPIPARTPGLGFLTSCSLKSPPPSCPHTQARQPLRVSGQVLGRSHLCCCPSRALRAGSLPAPRLPSSSCSASAPPTSAGAQNPLLTPQPPKADAGMGPGPALHSFPCPLPANHCAEVGRHPSFRKPLRAQRPLASAPPGLRGPLWTSRRQAQHETRWPPAG